jgi:hypothetical protein
MKYGYEIRYTDFWGAKTTCGVDGYDNSDDARNDVVELAKMDGWTNPKWWQWWRINDTRV